MKKVFLLFAVAAIFVACAPKAAETTEDVDCQPVEDQIEVVVEESDSLVVEVTEEVAVEVVE